MYPGLIRACRSPGLEKCGNKLGPAPNLENPGKYIVPD